MGRAPMSGPLEMRKQKITENARPLLEADEEVEVMAIGQTRVPAWLTMPFGFMAKVHAVAVTDRNVYAFQLAPFGPAKITEVAVKQPLGSVSVERKGSKLIVGDLALYVLLGAGGDADRVAGAANRSQPSPA